MEWCTIGGDAGVCAVERNAARKGGGTIESPLQPIDNTTRLRPRVFMNLRGPQAHARQPKRADPTMLPATGKCRNSSVQAEPCSTYNKSHAGLASNSAQQREVSRYARRIPLHH